MSDEPFVVKLEHVKEHENGDATYTFDMSDAARDATLEYGLNLIVYCAVAKVDLQDVYDWILAQAEEPKVEAKLPEGRTPLSKETSGFRDDWFREKAAAFSFDEYGYYGENNGPLPPTEDIRPMTKEERQRASEKAERNNHV